MTDLPKLLKSHYLQTLRSTSPAQWKVLVTDSVSRDLLLSPLKQSEVLEEKITEIQAIEDQGRQPTSFEAVYFLLPTTQNVERVIRDFDGQTMYKGAHVYFLDVLPKSLENRIMSSPLTPFLLNLGDLSTNLNALESRAFTTAQPSAFSSFYGPGSTLALADIEVGFIVKGLLNLFVLLNIAPQIRYQTPAIPLGPFSSAAPDPSSSSSSGLSLRRAGVGGWREAFKGGSSTSSSDGVCRRVAIALQRELDAFHASNPDFGKPPASSHHLHHHHSTQPPLLLITERALDTALPLLHEFTYQSLALSELPKELIKRSASGHAPPAFAYRSSAKSQTGGPGLKQHPLDEKDAVWAKIRHLHMRDAIEEVAKLTREAEEMGRGFEEGQGLDGLRSMLAGLTDFQEIKERAFVHTTLSDACMAQVNERQLIEVADVEQCCVTGVTPEGKTPRTLVEQMVPLLDRMNIRQYDKVRIIALYIMHKDGVTDEDRRRLYQHARLAPAEQDAVDNLVHLGVKISRNDPRQEKWKKQKYRGVTPENSYDTARYVPVLKTCLQELLTARLDPSAFPALAHPFAPSPGAPSLSPNPAPAHPSSLRSSRSGGLTSGAVPSPSSSPSPTPSSQGSLRSARPTWASASRGGSGSGSASGSMGRAAGPGPGAVPDRKALLAEKDRQKVVVFVCGGMTYGEMRSAYEVAEASGKDVLIGSTHTIVPEEYVKSLQNLARGSALGGGTAANAPYKFAPTSTALNRPDPYANRERLTAPPPPPPSEEEQAVERERSFLDAYDRKYWTEDIAPPPPPPQLQTTPPPAAVQTGKASKLGKSESVPSLGGLSAKEEKKLRKEKEKAEGKKKKWF